MWIVIRTSLVATAFRNSFGTFHHERSARRATLVCSCIIADVAGWPRLDSIFTIRIIRTAEKNSETTAALSHHALFADRALYAGRILSLKLGIFFDVFTLRIVCA